MARTARVPRDKTALLMLGGSAIVGAGALIFGRSSPAEEDSDDRVTADDVTEQPERPSSPRNGKRLTRSSVQENGTVEKRPAVLLDAARLVIPSITLDELTAARLASSELSDGTDVELRAIIDAELNRAEKKRQSITQHLTSLGFYGRQGTKTFAGKKRPAATSRDAYERHHQAAVDVLSGAGRGIALGAVRFFDPVAQLRAWKRWKRGESKRRHCHPRIILERWSLDLEWAKSGNCALNTDKPGRQPQEWIGPVAGIEPLRLMLFRPASNRHSEMLGQARRLIDALESTA